MSDSATCRGQATPGNVAQVLMTTEASSYHQVCQVVIDTLMGHKGWEDVKGPLSSGFAFHEQEDGYVLTRCGHVKHCQYPVRGACDSNRKVPGDWQPCVFDSGRILLRKQVCDSTAAQDAPLEKMSPLVPACQPTINC